MIKERIYVLGRPEGPRQIKVNHDFITPHSLKVLDLQESSRSLKEVTLKVLKNINRKAHLTITREERHINN